MVKTTSSTKKKAVAQQNTIETLKSLGSSAVKQPFSEISKMGMDVFDQMLGNYDDDGYEDLDFPARKKTEEKKPQPKQEFSIFNYREHNENQTISKEIKELTVLVRQEIEMVKKADSSLLAQVKDVEKITMDPAAEKPGIYHVRFLEVILSILRTLRLKINESKTWLQAMISKKQKRGSLFASRSKKMGTQYSLSQELQSSRSIQ